MSRIEYNLIQRGLGLSVGSPKQVPLAVFLTNKSGVVPDRFWFIEENVGLREVLQQVESNLGGNENLNEIDPRIAKEFMSCSQLGVWYDPARSQFLSVMSFYNLYSAFVCYGQGEDLISAINAINFDKCEIVERSA